MAHHYRPDIDGLRALAVSAVVVFHAFPGKLPGGFLGVDVFFVISGYLISGLILEGIRAGTFTITGFYLRRARRILPALLTMLLGVSLLALLILMPDEMERFAKSVTASALFVPNLALAREAGYFDPATDTNPLLHLWSLGVEEQFYLVWPLALLFAGRVRPKVTIVVIAVIALASLASHVVISSYSPTAGFYLPFTRFWQLLTGALLAAERSRAPRSRAALAPTHARRGSPTRCRSSGCCSSSARFSLRAKAGNRSSVSRCPPPWALRCSSPPAQGRCPTGLSSRRGSWSTSA